MTTSTALLVSVLATFLLAGPVASGGGKLPSTFKTCKQTEKDYNGCLKVAIQDAVPQLAEGVHSLEAIPIDPLHINSLVISEEEGKPVSINLEFYNIDIIGISHAIVDEIKMKPGSYHLIAKAHTDTPLSLIGPYKIKGKVLVLPIEGDGDCNITISNIDASIEIIGEPLEKDGEKYFDVKDFKFSFTTKKLYIHFEKLFNGDKALGDNMNSFLNENWEEILKELYPAIQQALSAAFRDISSHIFKKVPYNKIFPPS